METSSFPSAPLHASRRSLSWILALCLAMLTLVSTVLTLAILEVSATDTIRQQIGQRLSELAFQTTDKLDHGLFERYREVYLLAHRPRLRDRRLSVEDKETQLNEIQKTYPQYSWIGITDARGTVLASTQGLLRGVDVSARPWWQHAHQGIHLGDLHDAKLLAKKLPLVEGEPMRFIDVAFPMQAAGGEPSGVIGVHMNWEWAHDIERSVIEPAQARGKVDAMIVNSDGVVLLGPKTYRGHPLGKASLSATLAGENRYMVETWDDGRRYLVGYSRSRGYRDSPGLGWTVLVRQDLEQAYAPVRRLQREVLLGGVAIAILFSWCAFYAGKRIAAPLQALAADAERIRAGDSERLSASHSGMAYREVGDLGLAFTDLIDDLHRHRTALQQNNATLEQRVAERSAALAERSAALADSEKRLRLIADNLPVMVAYVDRAQHYRFCNRAYFDHFGLLPEQVVGRRVAELLGPEMYAVSQPYVVRVLSGERVTFVNTRSLPDGLQYLQLSYVPDVQEDGSIPGFYVMTQDITDTRVLQMSLQHDVLHDALTGLPNRVACVDQIAAALARSQRSGKPFAVMFLDVDRFKQINDSHGHDAGDRVLVELANRVGGCLRETDLIARLGGDEFVVVAENLAFPGDAVAVADKIHQALGAPSVLAGIETGISSSIGIAIHSGGANDADALLRLADGAMYEAKRAGRNRVACANETAPALVVGTAPEAVLETKLETVLEAAPDAVQDQVPASMPG